MNNQDNHPMDPSNLHQKSEELAMERTARPPVDSADLSPEEMRQTIHELRLQQIELERQNEELRTVQTQTKAEEALREQRDFSESLIETAQTIILVLDTQGRIVRFNPYMEQLVGYRLDEVKGLDWLETFIKLENKKNTRSVFIKTVDNIQTSGTVNSIITKDGRTVLVEWSNKTLKDKDGRTVGVLAIGQNISERKKVELQLVRDNILLKTQQEVSPDGILIVDENDNIISFNQRFCKIWEIPDHIMAEQSSEKAIQYVLPLLINPDEFIKRIRDLNKNKKSSSFEEIALTNGKILARHSAPMFGSDAQYYGRVWFYRDITERKRMEEALRESEDRFSRAIAGTGAGLWDWDMVKNTVFFSRQWKSMLGYADHEVENDFTGWKNLWHPEDAVRIEKAVSDYIEGRTTSYEVENRLRHKDGSWHWILTRGDIERDAAGTPVRWTGTNIDITERKRDEDALKTAYKLLEVKNQEMEQFVYIVSHDLKSPLVTVKTFTGMLRQDIQDGNQQQITEDLKYIDSSTDKMQQLLDALLQYSRIDTVDAPAQTVSADQQVQNCLAALAGILQQHQIQVSTDDLSHQLNGNLLQFGQVWQNLIENAVKYRGDQAQPHIEIGATQEGLDVVFYVRDNGMGIAPEHNERIFNLFSQLQPDIDGSGLGLALVKKIVTIYGGRIWVESEGAGRGSCFYFTLPKAVLKEDTAR